MLIKKESAAKQAAKVTKVGQATVVMNHRISFKGSGNDRKLILTKNGLELSCLPLPEHSGLTCETLQDCPIIIDITDTITNLEGDVSTLLNPNYIASQVIPLLVHNEHVNITASFDNINNKIVLTGTGGGGGGGVDFDCDDVASCIANNTATQLALLNWIQGLENLLLTADITFTGDIRFEGNNVLFKDGTVDYENTEISYDVNTVSNHNGDIINFNNSDIDISNGSLDLTSTSVAINDSNINVSDTTINYSNTDLVGGNYSNTTITASNISSTTLTDVNIDNSTITNTTLDGVTITGTLNLPNSSVKPTNLSGTTTNGSIVVRNNDNTFRDATPADIEAMGFDSGGTVQSSGFWEYELGENIPTGIHAVTLLNGEVNTNIPTLSEKSLSPSGETINGVNYKVTYSFPADLGIDNAWRIFNDNGGTSSNWAGTYHTTLELSQPISFNHLKYSGNDLSTDVNVYTSVNGTTWTLVSKTPSKRGGFHYIPTTTSRFIKVEFIRTPYNIPSLGGLGIGVVNTINNKVYIAKTSLPNYRIIHGYVLGPKSAGEIVKISNLENTTITGNWVDGKNQFVKDDGTIGDTGNIFIGGAYNGKLVVGKGYQPYPSKTYSMILNERLRWKARPFMKIYSNYSSNLGGSVVGFKIYNAKDMSVIYTFSAQNTYSGAAADASAVVFQSMTDMDIIIECTSMNTNEIGAINLTITQI